MSAERLGDWCEFSQMPASMCGHCRGSDGGESVFELTWASAVAAEEQPRRIEALYSGTCKRCGRRWAPGAEIEFDDGEQAWGHASCDGEGDGYGSDPAARD